MKKLTFSLIFVIILALIPFNDAAQASTVPTISILGVTEGELVTIKTHDFPADKDFEVHMGLIGTKGIDGILVGTINSGTGSSLAFTFSIPGSLADEELLAIRLDSTTGGYYSYNWFTNTTFGTHEGGVPTGEVTDSPIITVASVKEDTLVTIKAINFPVNHEMDVLMGEYGTAGIDGTFIGTMNSGEDGEFIQTFNIPDNLISESKIAIRFELDSGDTAVHTWFENLTGGSGGSTDDDSTGIYTGFPTISILTVDEDQNVTIRAYNFPAGKDFKVLMGEMGTQGIGGALVTTINSGEGGSFTATYDIPDSLAGEYQIAIRLQTSDGYFYAYNWFYNNTTSDGSASGGAYSGYTGIPTFTISGVVEDSTISIYTNNFPVNTNFRVLMGKMWTQGIDGIYVTTITSGSGSVFSKTFNIPASLAGEERISIRLEATTGSFYAYNWFYNATFP